MPIRGGIFKYQTLSDREKKNLLFLDIILRKGPISRTDISKETEYNIVTVSNYINNFIQKGIVVERGCDISSGGRKPTLLELDTRGGYVIGMDIGPVNIIGIMIDLGNKVIVREKTERPQGHMEEVIKAAEKLLNGVIETSTVQKNKIHGIGFGVSGIVDEDTGTIHDTDPRRGRTSGSINSFRSSIEARFGIPVFVGNDATCAAFGEKRLSIDRNVENMLYVYSDVGCGIIIKNDIYCGSGGSAGEMQLCLKDGNGREMGFSPSELSYLRPMGIDLGIVANARKVIDEGVGTKILELANGKADNIRLDHVIKAAENGDRPAIDLIESAGINLGTRIAYLINLFNPEIVVIGGGIEKAGELLLGPVRNTIRKLAFEEPGMNVRILSSALGEDAVALGGASLVLREVFTQI